MRLLAAINGRSRKGDGQKRESSRFGHRRQADRRSQLPLWAETRRRFTALQACFAAYECDVLAVLRLPALADVTVPATAEFVDAFALAQALLTDTAPKPAAAQRFHDAVEAAELAWATALWLWLKLKWRETTTSQRRFANSVSTSSASASATSP